ncbi:MAG: 30S ribosomal protein S6 [Candidatus Uhrbacteria bacterium]
MTNYELLYLSPLQESDESRAAIRDRVTGIIQQAGASIIGTREFARQRLAYPIGRHRAGEYIIVDFVAPESTLNDVQRELRLLSDVLRIMVTVKNERARTVGAEVKAMERARSEDATRVATKQTKQATETPAGPPPEIEDLDKRLEEILGKDMI